MSREPISACRLPKVGMRTIKTVVAVFICCIIDYLRGTIPVQSTIAAIICIQPDTENTIETAVARAIATLLGGVASALVMTGLSLTGMKIPSVPFYFILCLCLIPLIVATVQTGWKSATALTCIVFLVIGLNYTDGYTPFVIAGMRMVDTLVGIAVALPVNLLLPTPRPPSAENCCQTHRPSSRAEELASCVSVRPCDEKADSPQQRQL